MDAEEMARQISLLDFKKYSSIKLTEFYNKAWTKKDKDKVSPHLLEMIDGFNNVSFCNFVLYNS